MDPLPIVLADRHEGVRIALREQLESAGVARTVGEAATLAEARAAVAGWPDAVVVAGLTFPDGDVMGLLRTGARVVVYGWLPADEHGLDLAAAEAVVGLPMIPGLLDTLHTLRRVAYDRHPTTASSGRAGVRAFHLSLPVADLAAATDFYADVLGCPRRRTGPDWADLDFHGHQLSLHEVAGYTPEPHRSVVDGVEVPARHLGVVLDPDAWRALVADLEERGVEFLLTPRSRFEGQPGEQHTFFLTDPSGNAIEVKAFPDGVWT